MTKFKEGIQVRENGMIQAFTIVLALVSMDMKRTLFALFLLFLASFTSSTQPLGGTLYIQVLDDGQAIQFVETHKNRECHSKRFSVYDQSERSRQMEILNDNSYLQKTLFWLGDYELKITTQDDTMIVKFLHSHEGHYFIQIPFLPGTYALNMRNTPINHPPENYLIQGEKNLERYIKEPVNAWNISPIDWSILKIKTEDTYVPPLLTNLKSTLNGTYKNSYPRVKCWEEFIELKDGLAYERIKASEDCGLLVREKTGRIEFSKVDSIHWETRFTLRGTMKMHLIEGREPDMELDKNAGRFEVASKDSMTWVNSISVFSLVQKEKVPIKNPWKVVSNNGLCVFELRSTQLPVVLEFNSSSIGKAFKTIHSFQYNRSFTYSFRVDHPQETERIQLKKGKLNRVQSHFTRIFHKVE